MLLIYTRIYLVLQHSVASWKTIKIAYDIKHKWIWKSMSKSKQQPLNALRSPLNTNLIKSGDEIIWMAH